MVKFFLHVSEEEQRRRLLERLDEPDKQWKFSPADLAEHGRYAEYQRAYEEALSATSTPWAPWYVVPADHKHAMRALVSGVIVHELEQLHLEMPKPDAAQRAAIKKARRELSPGLMTSPTVVRSLTDAEVRQFHDHGWVHLAAW